MHRFIPAVVVVTVLALGCAPLRPGLLPAPGGVSSDALMRAGAAVGFVDCRVVPRRVRGGPGTTPVKLCAAPYAHQISATGVGIPAQGLIVATLENQGTGREIRWDLAPQRTAFLVLYPGPGITFYAILAEAASPSAPADILESGRYIVCPGHPNPPRTRSRAEFRYCSDQPHPQADALRSLPIRSFAPVMTAPPPDESGGPTWLTCPEGCCGTEQSTI